VVAVEVEEAVLEGTMKTIWLEEGPLLVSQHHKKLVLQPPSPPPPWMMVVAAVAKAPSGKNSPTPFEMP